MIYIIYMIYLLYVTLYTQRLVSIQLSSMTVTLPSQVRNSH